MSLYLCIFKECSDDEDDPEEIDGWQLGSYSDFGYFRDSIVKNIPNGNFPTLLNHSDCDGEWTTDELPNLVNELNAIKVIFQKLPPIKFSGAFEWAKSERFQASSLYECFHNVDSENLIDSLISLANTAIKYDRPISFQ